MIGRMIADDLPASQHVADDTADAIAATRDGALGRIATLIDQPVLDWVALAQGHGVPAARASTADAFVREMQRALASGGPYLVEVVL
ncbi:MAG: thiamine pyrophosphate-dependent enzyme [Burkholderiaceae bacterium]